MSNLTYPHTTISRDLQTLAQRVANDPELLALVNGVQTMYNAKRQFWTSRIDELESQSDSYSNGYGNDAVRNLPGYPHTTISSDIDALRASLKNSSSSERQTRLDLLESISSQYRAKRDFFFTTIKSLL